MACMNCISASLEPAVISAMSNILLSARAVENSANLEDAATPPLVTKKPRTPPLWPYLWPRHSLRVSPRPCPSPDPPYAPSQALLRFAPTRRPCDDGPNSVLPPLRLDATSFAGLHSSVKTVLFLMSQPIMDTVFGAN